MRFGANIDDSGFPKGFAKIRKGIIEETTFSILQARVGVKLRRQVLFAQILVRNNMPTWAGYCFNRIAGWVVFVHVSFI